MGPVSRPAAWRRTLWRRKPPAPPSRTRKSSARGVRTPSSPDSSALRTSPWASSVVRSASATRERICPRSASEFRRRSSVAREILGEEFVDHYIRTRTWEVRQYERAVTTWELERYFELA